MKPKYKIIILLTLILTFLILYYYMNNIKNKNNIEDLGNQILNENVWWWIWVHSSEIQKDYWED